MKNILLLLILVSFVTSKSAAQSLAINTDGSTANTSAILDVKSTAKGLLVPRMSKAERNAIVAPATGLLIFQNAPDSTGFYYYDGSKWNWMASLNGNADTLAWKRNGNAGTNPSVNFIGTVDNQPISLRQDNKWLGNLNATMNNYAVGAGAGENNTTGMNNVVVGDSAGNASTAASNNVLIGTNAGINNLGSWTTMIGIDVGRSNQVHGSVFIGSAAGMRNTTGGTNTFVGDNAGRDNTTGSGNTFMGRFTGSLSNGNDNSFLGNSAGLNNTTGNKNVFVGSQAGMGNTTGGNNIALGVVALRFNSANSNLIAIGDSALYFNAGGASNTAIGSRALYANSFGFYNTAIGFRALNSNSTGMANTALGNLAAFSNTLSYWQVAIGDSALYSNTGSAHNANTAIGAHAGAYNPGSSGCIYMGFRSGYNSIDGIGNIFVGSYAGQYSNDAAYNIGIGDQTLRNLTGYYNIAIGSGAMQQSRSSYSNTAVGLSAMANDTSGTYNTAFGQSVLQNSTNSSLNTALGHQAMLSHKTGNYNTATGYNALFSDTVGIQNVAVGYYAMRNYQGNNNTSLGTNSLDFTGTGNNNTAIGYDADVLKTNLSNATAIGAFSRIDTSNALVLGSTTINVGIGITKPYQAKLTVSANNASAGSTLAILGYGQQGISFQQNNPTIGYNQYRDISAGNAARYMGNGFAWVNHMDPTTGNIYWNSMPSGTANAAGGAETVRMTLTNTGSLGLNVIPNGTGQLQFQNVLDNRKIVMWETVNNTVDFFGFGINSGTLRYQVPAGGGNIHRFFAGNTVLYTIFDNGNATLAGTLTQLSDASLKQNIIPINSSINDIKKINAYHYYWRDENRDRDQQIGLLAQEVQKVFPQLVKKDSEGLLSVNYSGFTPLLIKGMQEQQAMIDGLQKQVEELRQLIKK